MPTCPGNRPDGNNALCYAALDSCSNDGDVRYWVYTRQFNRVTQTYLSPWRLVTTPRYTCLALDAPGVDPLIAVIATVRRDFKQFPIDKAVVATRPAGLTLVNAPTEVSTTATGMDVLRQTILGMPVVVTAVATSYTWRFGDGTVLTVPAGAGRPAAVAHVYATTGPRAVSLDVTYGGTFTVGGSPTVYDVDGTATIVGPAAALEVREAKTQLEAGPTL